MMSASTKTWILWGALLITLGLVWKTQPSDDSDVVQPSRTFDSQSPVKSADSGQTMLVLIARQSTPSLENLFANPLIASEQTLAKSAEKPPPIAPPIPFEYMGRWKENGELTLMLVANDEVFTVRQGDILLNTYQLIELTESNLGIRVGLMYLPLKQMQFLDVGKAKNE